MTKNLVAHDLGTSGNKATLFAVDGELVKSTVASYGTHYFNANFAEQDPGDWWKAVCDSSRRLMDGIDPKAVAAVSFSGQMMGTLCVDKDGAPLRPHIIWADMRAVKEQEEILSKIDAWDFYRMTGHRASASYSLAKLLWVKNNEPDVYAKTAKALHAKDYIVFKMTGKFMTDYSDASGTNAFDLNKFEWSSEILDAVNVDMDLFPEAVESIHVAGEMTTPAANECGMAPGTPVVMGAGDGIAACVGAGSVREGITYNCLGSSSWIATTTREPIYDDKMRTFTWAHMTKGMVSPCGTMQTAGAAYAWMKKELCKYEELKAEIDGGSAYDMINTQIAAAPAGSNGVFYLPHLLGERSPRWNPNARGTFLGLKMENTHADLLRGVAEGIAMNLRLILDIIKTGVDVKEVIVMGGLAKSDGFLQILADVFGLDILPLNYLEEASSIGAAVAAGVGVGALSGIGEVARFVRPAGRFSPNEQNNIYYQKALRLFDKAYHSLEEVYDEMAKL
jgi:xylulokinase